MHTKTLIIGGGLAGLALAEKMHLAGEDFVLLEARSRLGGRIRNMTVNDAAFDLGPAWFWPGQPRIEALVARHALTRFDQYAKGMLTYEDHNGVQRGQGYASMEGSYRLKGGLGALITALQQALPRDRIRLGTPVSRVVQQDDKVVVTTPNHEVSAQRVVFCLPPRLVAQMDFQPTLDPESVAALQGIPTWMAGQAKAVAVFDRPFWREAGLSGDAISRIGPMVETHDASPQSGRVYALFGFIGVPPDARRNEAKLRADLIAQLGRLFGAKAATPIELLIKDWAFDPYTSTQADQVALNTHPQYGLPPAMAAIWNGRLIFGGSEVAPQFGGFLEGALEAAEIAFKTLKPVD